MCECVFRFNFYRDLTIKVECGVNVCRCRCRCWLQVRDSAWWSCSWASASSPSLGQAGWTSALDCVYSQVSRITAFFDACHDLTDWFVRWCVHRMKTPPLQLQTHVQFRTYPWSLRDHCWWRCFCQARCHHGPLRLQSSVIYGGPKAWASLRRGCFPRPSWWWRSF